MPLLIRNDLRRAGCETPFQTEDLGLPASRLVESGAHPVVLAARFEGGEEVWHRAVPAIARLLGRSRGDHLPRLWVLAANQRDRRTRSSLSKDRVGLLLIGPDVRLMFASHVHGGLGALYHRAPADQPDHHKGRDAGDGGSKTAGFQHPGVRELQRTVGVAADHERFRMPLVSVAAEPTPKRGQHVLGSVAVLKAGDDYPLLSGRSGRVVFRRHLRIITDRAIASKPGTAPMTVPGVQEWRVADLAVVSAWPERGGPSGGLSRPPRVLLALGQEPAAGRLRAVGPSYPPADRPGGVVGADQVEQGIDAVRSEHGTVVAAACLVPPAPHADLVRLAVMVARGRPGRRARSRRAAQMGDPGLLAQLKVALKQPDALGGGRGRGDAVCVFLGADVAQGGFEVGVGPAHRVVVGAVRLVCAWILHSQGSVLVSARFGVEAPAGRALVLSPPYCSA